MNDKKDLRKSDMVALIEKLDISPTMYKDAVEKYKNLGNYLSKKGIEADFYPQGSFSLGTVVRPYKNNDDANYDLDAICQIHISKSQTSPELIKETLEKAFEDDETYNHKLKKYDTCCTIEYAENNDIGFSIDIVPAVEEDDENKALLKESQKNVQYADTAIAITHYDKSEKEYKWGSNNPKAFKKWFEEVNIPFREQQPQRTRQQILKENKMFFASIEEIPVELERSSLQRVIQILKRHRDVYFSKEKDGDDLKPKSAIITTIIALIAQSARKDLNVFDLLTYILSEINIYSEHLGLNEAEFIRKFEYKKIVEKRDGEWWIENPVNAQDNLADGWNNNPDQAKAFFDWVKLVSSDLLVSLEKEDEEFLSVLESALGSKFVRRSIDISKYSKPSVQPTTFTPKQQAKPWSM